MDDFSNYGWTKSCPAFFSNILLKSKTKHAADSFESKDLITTNKEICYIWRSDTRTIIRAFCSDIWGIGSTVVEDIDQYKEYSTSPDVIFEPTRIDARLSQSAGELVMLWSSSALAVVELGAGVGPTTVLASQPAKCQKSVLRPASCIIPDDKTYLEHLGLRILQAKWYPNPDHDIVVVLNNDNYLRLYLLSQPETYISKICVGPPMSVPFQYSTHAVGLIETPIDFDFGPVLASSEYTMIFILKSSGEITYLLLKYVAPNYQFQWHHRVKELTIDDDEIEDCFQDAAAILVSKTFPLLLIIGCTSGNLHHVVLFPFEFEDVPLTTSKLNISMEESVVTGDVILYIKEVVQIEPEDDEIGLPFMNLLPDPLCNHRYAAIHGEGVHIVNINFIPQIESIFKPNANSQIMSASTLAVLDSNNSHQSTITTKPSSIRHVLKCKLFENSLSASQNAQRQKLSPYKSNFTFSDSVAQKFVLTLGDYGTSVYDIPHLLNGGMGAPVWTDEAGGNSTTGGTQSSASQHLKAYDGLKSILQKPINQPLLLRQPPKDASTDVDETDPEGAQLIAESLRTLEQDYLNKQEQALKHLEESFNTITLDTKEFGSHMSSFMVEELATVKADSSRFAEECKNLVAKQLELQKRAEAAISAHHDQIPVLTDEEKKWLLVLSKLESEVESMGELIGGLIIKVTNPLLPQGQDTMQEIISQAEFSEPQLNKIRLSVARQQQMLTNLKNTIIQIRQKLPNA